MYVYVLTCIIVLWYLQCWSHFQTKDDCIEHLAEVSKLRLLSDRYKFLYILCSMTPVIHIVPSVCGGYLWSVICVHNMYYMIGCTSVSHMPGMVVQRRLSEVEVKWPYFLGFGLPLASLTSTPLLSPVVVGGSVVRHAAASVVIRLVHCSEGKVMFEMELSACMFVHMPCQLPLQETRHWLHNYYELD